LLVGSIKHRNTGAVRLSREYPFSLSPCSTVAIAASWVCSAGVSEESVDESGPDAMDDAVEELGNEPFSVGRANSGAAVQA